jgi:myo-inositol-1(or 4)-monophosphatase
MENLNIKSTEQENFSIEEIEKIARGAGNLIKVHYGRGTVNQFKSGRRVVTIADRESEQFLKEKLLKIHPCGFYGEEGGGVLAQHGDQWAVDPLDGTENMNGYPPLLAISIGLLRDNKPILGVIYDPIHDILYSAREGDELKINGEVTRAGSETDPTSAVVALDFSSEMETRLQTLGQLSCVLKQARAVKIFGAPVLSLAAVATGRLDLFFRPSTKITDMIAGVYLVRASGGKVADFSGRDWTVRSRGIVAGRAGMIEAYLHCFS